MRQPSPSGNSIPSLADVIGHSIPVPLLRRVAAEFRDMPGLVLSIPQASRLLGVDEDACTRIFAALVRDGVLSRRSGGLYGRP